MCSIITSMAHSPLINRKNNFNSYYGSSSFGPNYQPGSNYRQMGLHSHHGNPISVRNQPSGISRHNSHHISSSTLPDRKGPLRADHNIRLTGIISNNRTERKQNISSFTPLNRQKSSSLNNLSTSSTSSGKYRTLFDRITNGSNDSCGNISSRDGDNILQSAKLKLEKLNKDWPANKPLSKRYSSMSDISTKNDNTVKDELQHNLDFKSRNKKQNQQHQKQTLLTMNRATSDVINNRSRRQSIDNSALSSNKNISSGLETVPPTQDNNSHHMSSKTTTSKATIQKQEKYGIGIVGLRNLGNTCFMNSILQCLCKSKTLRSYFFNKEYKKDINEQFKPTRGRLTIAFGDLVHDMWSSSTPNAISPSYLKSEVEKFAPTFIGTHQHDSQEFLRFFIEGIHDELNAVRRKPTFHDSDDSGMSDDEKAHMYWRQYLSREESVIQGLFVGQLRSTLKCSTCAHCSVTYDPFWDLSLPITVKRGGVNVNIADCFKTFTQEETLDGEEKPTCEKCKKRRKCTKRFLIQKFPKILVIHLKRFSGHRFRTKLSTKVVFPMELNIGEFVDSSSESREPPVYNLFGVSNHMGGTSGGHYTAYCKHPDTSKWHLYNDTRVTEAASSDIVSSSAYVLFYSLSTADS